MENDCNDRKDPRTIAQKIAVYSWIVQEIEQNGNDLVEIICKGGENCSISTLLLSAISPCLSVELASFDIQDTKLILPDTDIDVIRGLKRFLCDLYKPSNALLSGEEISCLKKLDGIFWQNSTTNPVFSSEGFQTTTNKEYPMMSHTKSDAVENAFDEEMDTDVKIEDANFYQEDNQRREWKSDEYGPMISDGKGTATLLFDGEELVPIVKKDTLKDYSVEYKRKAISMIKSGQSQRLVAQKLNIGKRTLERWWAEHKKSKKLSDSETIKLDIQALLDEGMKKAEIMKKYKLTPKMFDKMLKENQSRKENNTSKRLKSGECYRNVTPEDLTSVEGTNFHEAQEKLRLTLIDDQLGEDPRKLWEEYHGGKFDVNLKKPMICPVCKLIFTSSNLRERWKYFIQHLRNHKYENFSCECAHVHELNFRSHIEEMHWEWTNCELCPNSKLMDTATLKGHNRRVHGNTNKDNELVCPHCGKHFSKRQKAFFGRHVKNHLVDNFNCDCPIKFSNRRQKAQHVKLVHKENYIGCEKCSFVTTSQQALEEHLKKHDPSMRQICDICGFVSNSSEKYAIQSHKAIHHDPVLHPCSLCDGKFNSKQLKIHMKSHQESVCMECGLKVKNLRSHMNNVHTPDHLKKHKCSYCTKGFNDVGKLQQHIFSVHTKERPYKCRFGCDLGYNDTSNRNAHEKKKHGKLFSTKRSNTNHVPEH
eukprot:TRINITY_DN7616_c0_g1_i2.p1 TRINITY_DN7616_c0_g1~~TRINITY_DN7616_c0_g1_i2.p1  ORF type:complete len:704 (-),score=85.19 TRINITY_DN7616_c0_g1_i2:60-2171(-)